MTKIPPSKGLRPTSDFLGEPFSLDKLILPRPACAYGVQWLGSDQLLHKHQQTFISVRQVGRDAFFSSYGSAAHGAITWLEANPQTPPPPLAIVPLGWDDHFARVILIQGILTP